jgi:cysteine desulfurase
MIYLDHHAASPVCPAAREAMDAALSEAWANPSSVHAAGRRARFHLEQARRRVAEACGTAPARTLLCSGGTEALTTAVLGLGARCGGVVTTVAEHPSVARSVARLERAGLPVTRLRVEGGNPPDADELDRAVHALTSASRATRNPDAPLLVCVQWVNHETGTLFPVADYARVCRARGAWFVVDATQALGKVPLDADALGAAALAVASHKIGGPAGAAALLLAVDVDLPPLLAGGGQERGLRPGTPDVVAAVGFGAAAGEVPARLGAMSAVAVRRDRLERALVARGARVAADGAARVATVTNVAFPGRRGDVLVAALDVEGVCASSGAACSSGVAAPSEVLRAMYPAEPWRAEGALRLSLGPETSDADVRGAVEALDRILARAC